MAYLILFVFCIVGIYGIQIKKNIGPLIILYYTIAPNVPLMGSTFDSTYFFIPIMLVFILIRNGGRLYKYRNFKGFIILSVVWVITYFIGWILGDMHQPRMYFISSAGLLKTILAIYLLHLAPCSSSEKNLDKTVGRGLEYVLGFNAVAVFLQWLIPLKMYDICYKLYYSADSSGYTSYETITSWGSGFYNGRYYRYFGLFETPMIFSCVIILALTFYVIQISSERRFFKYPRIVFFLSMLLGILAQCKIFFLMLPILVSLYVICNVRRLTGKRVIAYSVIVIGAFFVIMNLDSISSSSMFQYLKYLKEPLEAFSTRFSSGGNSEGYLDNTLNIAFQNILTGVGPVSVEGESIADSSYIVLLHNGGIIACIAMIIYYFSLFRNNIRIKHSYLNLLIIVLAIMGASRTVMLYGSVLIIIVYYLTENLNVSRQCINLIVKERVKK